MSSITNAVRATANGEKLKKKQKRSGEFRATASRTWRPSKEESRRKTVAASVRWPGSSSVRAECRTFAPPGNENIKKTIEHRILELVRPNPSRAGLRDAYR